MLVLFIAALCLFLYLESRARKAKNRELAEELADLRLELELLRAQAAGAAPDRPEPDPHGDTAPVEVPAWIRERRVEPAPAELARPAVPHAAVPAPVPPPRALIPSAPPLRAPSVGFDWESLIGVKMFSYIAGIALLVAAVAFLRYSIDNGWLRPEVRMTIGLLAGLGLLALCENRRAQTYAVTAQSLAAAGMATLFSTFYASAALWHLLPPWLAFLLMALVTALAVALSIRRDSVFIALLGLVGGFATPLLLSTGEDRPIALFGYLALLNLGLGWVAYRKRWPVLTAITLGCTVLYQLGWVVSFLGEGNLATGIGVFLLFPALAFGALLLARKDGELPGLFQKATVLSALPPFLLALRLAMTPAFGQHFGLMFGFLFLVAAGLATIALFHGPEWLHALGAGGTLAVFGAWTARSYAHEAWPVILAIAAPFIGLYLFIPWLQAGLARKRPFGGPGLLAVYAAPLLLFLFPALVFLEPASAAPGTLFGALALFLALVAASAVRSGDGRPHMLACCFALAAEAAWSWRFLDPQRLLPALLIYGGFSLFFLGVPLWAERRGRPLRPGGTGALLALATLAGHLFLMAVAFQPALAFPPWSWLALLLVLDLAIGGAALLRRRAGALAGSAVLTQLLLIGWGVQEGHAPLVTALAPWAGLGFAVLGLVWFELGRRRGAVLVRPAGLGLLGAQALLVVLQHQANVPGFGLRVLVHGLLGLGLLALAWRSGRQGWAVALACGFGMTLLIASLDLVAPMGGSRLLALAAPLYLVQLAYPLALGRRARDGRQPFLAALLATGIFFLAARPALMELGCGPVIGALPALQGLLLVPHLLRLLRLQPPGQRDLGRLAAVAVGILACVTVAIPLQVDREWMTLGWALLGLALAWLYGRVPHRGLLLWAWGLFATVFARLALNGAVLDYHPRGAVPVWNWYLYTYLIAAACCFGAAWLLKDRDDLPLRMGLPRLSRVLPGAGAALLFLLLNIEIADCFSSGPALTFNLLHGSLAQDLSYTLGWALFAVVMLAAGLVARNRLTRVAAILLLTATVLKTFLHDLSRLDGLYRVASFVGLAVSLALVAVILQKFVLRRGEEAA